MTVPATWHSATFVRPVGRGRIARRFTSSPGKRGGIILVLVAAVIVMLSLLGMSFLVHVSTENRAVHVNADQLQRAELLASGVELLGVLVEQPPALREAAGGCWDNPALLRGVLVYHDQGAKRHGRVSIVAPKLEGETVVGTRFGAENESAKLSLAALVQWEVQEPGRGEQALMSLPGMTQPLAAAIMDWLDADAEPRFNGAEADYYASQYLSYGPRNGIPVNLEELLLVRDMVRESLLGADTDANYQPDRGHTGSEPMLIGGPTGAALPWSYLLTVYSAERNVNFRGQPRIDLNHPDLLQLYSQLARRLDPELAAFVVLYRRYGPWQGDAEIEAEPISPPPQETSAAGQSHSSAGGPISASGPQSQSAQLLLEKQDQAWPPITFRPDRDPLRAPAWPGQPEMPPAEPIGPKALSPGRYAEGLFGELEGIPGPWSDQPPSWLLSLLRQGPGGSGRAKGIGSGAGARSALGTASAGTGLAAQAASGAQGDSGGEAGSGASAGQTAALQRLESVLDLVGAQVRVPHPGGGPAWIIHSPIQDNSASLRQYLPQLLAETTVDPEPVIHGRVNINLAPLAVLRAVPGMDSYVAAQIVAARQQASDAPDRQHPAWPLLEGIVDLPTMRALLPYLTTGGDVYRAQVIGYYDEGGPQVRSEVVIDATVAPARLVYFKQLGISASAR